MCGEGKLAHFAVMTSKDTLFDYVFNPSCSLVIHLVGH